MFAYVFGIAMIIFGICMFFSSRNQTIAIQIGNDPSIHLLRDRYASGFDLILMMLPNLAPAFVCTGWYIFGEDPNYFLLAGAVVNFGAAWAFKRLMATVQYWALINRIHPDQKF